MRIQLKPLNRKIRELWKYFHRYRRTGVQTKIGCSLFNDFSYHLYWCNHIYIDAIIFQVFPFIAQLISFLLTALKGVVYMFPFQSRLKPCDKLLVRGQWFFSKKIIDLIKKQRKVTPHSCNIVQLYNVPCALECR